MAGRSLESYQLTHLLTRRTGRWVGLTCLDHELSRWNIIWTDGPTRATMCHLVTTLVDEHDLDEVAVEHLRYHHEHSRTAEAVALLLYLDAYPHEAPTANTRTVRLAVEAIDYPDHAAEVWQRRARALLGPAAGCGPSASLAAGRFAGIVTRNGWPATLTWLDRLSPADGTVTDLTTFRAEHRRRQRTTHRM